jgi:hypothetical protein
MNAAMAATAPTTITPMILPFDVEPDAISVASCDTLHHSLSPLVLRGLLAGESTRRPVRQDHHVRPFGLVVLTVPPWAPFTFLVLAIPDEQNRTKREHGGGYTTEYHPGGHFLTSKLSQNELALYELHTLYHRC